MYKNKTPLILYDYRVLKLQNKGPPTRGKKSSQKVSNSRNNVLEYELRLKLVRAQKPTVEGGLRTTSGILSKCCDYSRYGLFCNFRIPKSYKTSHPPRKKGSQNKRPRH